MAEILKGDGVNIEGKTVYDGNKTLLVNVLQNEVKDDNNELMAALEPVPVSLQKYILSYIENYKKKLGKEYQGREKAVFDSARKSGYEGGFNEGRNEALRLLEDSIKNIRKAANSIEQFKNILYEDVKADVIELTFNIAQIITKQIVSTNYDALRGIIADAINNTSATVNFKIYLNAADYNTINKNPDLIKDSITKETNIEFLPDPNILQGDVIIKTDFGEIDARLVSQIAQIKKAFTKITPN